MIRRSAVALAAGAAVAFLGSSRDNASGSSLQLRNQDLPISNAHTRPAQRAVSADVATPPPPSTEARAAGVLRKYQDRLLSLDGVTGVGIGADPRSGDVIIVYVHDRGVEASIPEELDRVAVVKIITGEIAAY